MVKKQKLSISKAQVDKSGDKLRANISDSSAKEVVREFRSCHNYPLSKISMLVTRRLSSLGIKSFTVAQRLKRLPTIIDKLNRDTLDGKTNNKVRLSQMDDIGGCRVIVDNIEDVYKLKDSLVEKHGTHGLKIKDYIIDKLKKTGYRSIHLIFKSFDTMKNHESKGLKIELQIRTRVQHAWATAVEMVDIFESLDLKTNINTENEDWSNLFKISSRLLAISEMDENIDKDKYIELRDNLRLVEDKLNAYNKINDFKTLINLTSESEKLKRNTVYVLSKEIDSVVLQGKYFTTDVFDEAVHFYQEMEDDNKVVYTALVGTKSFETFKKAYPNFSADARYFLSLLSQLRTSDKKISLSYD